MNIVILDAEVANPGDLDWNNIKDQGNLTIFENSYPNQIIERANKAEVIITNKCKIGKSVIEKLPNLRCICLLATGYDNIDLDAAAKNNIVVYNAKGYSGPSVAQHVFGLILELTNRIGQHSIDIHKGKWTDKNVWSYCDSPIVELKDKTLGIFGLGSIGSRVATIGLAFGMKIIATRKNNKPPNNKQVKLVTQDELFRHSDILTLHTPLTEETKYVINEKTLEMMKESSILINTGRGDLINEGHLRKALDKNKISGAALDVLSMEPPLKNHILIGVPNCILTPHHAWATKESRRRLIDIVAQNIISYKSGEISNRVNK